jgi:predicted amidophosphoribosyltransferase
LRERGYNQAGLLAAYTSEMINCSDISDLLIRVKQTGRQSEQFSRAARFDNLQDAFALDLTNCRNIANLLRNRRILLIDDVLTTGATMLEAAKPLMSEGAEVYCLAVASDHA